MSEVHVTLPLRGRTFVDNDPEPVISERRIEWHFLSKRTKAVRVGIEFDRVNAKIFKIENDRSEAVKLAEAELAKAMKSRSKRAAIKSAEVKLAKAKRVEAKSAKTKTTGMWRSSFAKDLKNNRAMIWAEPARLGKNGKHLQARLKYTIVAWDAKGNRIKGLVLDPKIIIDDP
jgi:hypothetical protein